MDVNTAFKILDQLDLSPGQKRELSRRLEGKKRPIKKASQIITTSAAVADFKNRLLS